MYDETYQLIKIKGSSRDPPYMMRLKHLCKKRNMHIKERDEHDLQEHIDNLIWKNQMQSIHQENRKHGTGSKKWWDSVNKITEKVQ